MRLHLANWKWACIPGAILTGLAMLVVFGFHPGGFESQGMWLFVLLPGTLAVYPLSDLSYRLAPHAEPAIFWMLVFGFNFIWYWGISFIVVKTLRTASWQGF
jgi:hypothetical protein